MPIPIGHIPCTMAHTQVSGISHQRRRPSSRVRSQAPSGEHDQQVAQDLRAHRQAQVRRAQGGHHQERHHEATAPATGHEVQRRGQGQDLEPGQPGDAGESEPVLHLGHHDLGEPLRRHPVRRGERADRPRVTQRPAGQELVAEPEVEVGVGVGQRQCGGEHQGGDRGDEDQRRQRALAQEARHAARSRPVLADHCALTRADAMPHVAHLPRSARVVRETPRRNRHFVTTSACAADLEPLIVGEPRYTTLILCVPLVSTGSLTVLSHRSCP